MKEHPIIFNTEMVRAILEDRKTQTRRVIKPQIDCIEMVHLGVGEWQPWKEDKFIGKVIRCPYGKIGDRLWVKETWFDYGGEALYKADMDEAQINGLKGSFKPSIFMPRWASRITLEITNIRVGRLRDISEEDAKAEGVDVPDRFKPAYDYYPNGENRPYARAFGFLWDSINEKRGYSWDKDPRVWVIEFRRWKK